MIIRKFFGDFTRYDLLQGLGLAVIQFIVSLIIVISTNVPAWVAIIIGIFFNWSLTLVIWCIVKKALSEARVRVP
jgi:hypothetical protein